MWHRLNFTRLEAMIGATDPQRYDCAQEICALHQLVDECHDRGDITMAEFSDLRAMLRILGVQWRVHEFSSRTWVTRRRFAANDPIWPNRDGSVT